MNEEAIFLRAIVLYPDDDLPRLVYADWLEERGDPRSEFIRVQIALHELHPDPSVYVVGSADLRKRERELLTHHWRELVKRGLSGWVFGRGGENQFDGHRPGSPKIVVSTAFRRGFLTHVECGQYEWLKHGPQIVQQHPIQTVTLTDGHWHDAYTQTAGIAPNIRLFIWQLPESYDAYSLGDVAEINTRRYQSTEVYRTFGGGPNRITCDTRERRTKFISETCVLYARIKAGLHVECPLLKDKGRHEPLPDEPHLGSPRRPCAACNGLGWRVAEK